MPILPWTRVSHYLNQPRQTTYQKDPLMDRPIKVPSWCCNNRLHGFSCSHRVPGHGEKFYLSHFSYQTISSLFRWHYELQVTLPLPALVIASHFFALADPVIPLLTLLKMTDFPLWISESRTSISEPVKLFFLHLDAILMTQHFLAQEMGSVALYGIILGVEYANLQFTTSKVVEGWWFGLV